MSWAGLLDLIADELGADAAHRVQVRAQREMLGERLTITARFTVRREQVDEAAPGRPREAAKVLGVHPSTAYRALRRHPYVR